MHGRAFALHGLFPGFLVCLFLKRTPLCKGSWLGARRRDGEQKMKDYNKANIPLAKELRQNMTPWERKLWYNYLRSNPVRFQRQKALGNYITDFYCAKAGIVIELDGSEHYGAEQAKQDAARTHQLEAMRLVVLRFCNIDINENFSAVCEAIDTAVKSSLPQSAAEPLPAPSSEGAN